MEMLFSTIEEMEKTKDGPGEYSPSERYNGTAYVTTEAGEYDKKIRRIYEAANLSQDQNCLKNPDVLLSYFVRFRDDKNRKLVAVRKAQHFKGILGKKLICITGDYLRMFSDDVFKLDNDFDLIMDSERTHVLRPTAFEALGELQEKILEAVSKNVEEIRSKILFVDFDEIETYAKDRVSAARLLASIKKHELLGIDESRFKAYCGNNKVKLGENNGKIKPDSGHELEFLRALDRRLFVVDYVPNNPERYSASNRTKVA